MSRLRIRKLGVLSVAKMYAAIMFVISLLIAIPYGLFVIAFSLMGAAGAQGDAALLVGGGGIVAGIAVMILMPLIYAALGFIFGAIGALIYNIFARMIGGVEIEVENLA